MSAPMIGSIVLEVPTSHRLAIRSDLGEVVDPDGFVWEPATADRLG